MMTGKQLTDASPTKSAKTVTKPKANSKAKTKKATATKADGDSIVATTPGRAKSRNQLLTELNSMLLALAKGEPMVSGDKAGEAAAIYPTLEQRLKVITMLLKQIEQAAASTGKTKEEKPDGGKKSRATRAYSADELRELLAHHLAELSGEKPARKTVSKAKGS
jgi:hypothetical protein